MMKIMNKKVMLSICLTLIALILLPSLPVFALADGALTSESDYIADFVEIEANATTNTVTRNATVNIGNIRAVLRYSFSFNTSSGQIISASAPRPTLTVGIPHSHYRGVSSRAATTTSFSGTTASYIMRIDAQISSGTWVNRDRTVTASSLSAW